MGRWYLAAFGGYELASDYEYDYLSTDVDVEEDGGAIVGASAGYHMWDNVRGELEVSYTSSDAESTDTFRDGQLVLSAIDADVRRLSVMFNIYQDLELIEDRLDLYVGGGLGIAIREQDLSDNFSVIVYRAGTDFSQPLTEADIERVDTAEGGTSLSLQAQVLVGLALHVTEDVALTAGYRGTFLGADDFDGLNVDESFRSAFEAGLRFTF